MDSGYMCAKSGNGLAALVALVAEASQQPKPDTRLWLPGLPNNQSDRNDQTAALVALVALVAEAFQQPKTRQPVMVTRTSQQPEQPKQPDSCSGCAGCFGCRGIPATKTRQPVMVTRTSQQPEQPAQPPAPADSTSFSPSLAGNEPELTALLVRPSCARALALPALLAHTPACIAGVQTTAGSRNALRVRPRACVARFACTHAGLHCTRPNDRMEPERTRMPCHPFTLHRLRKRALSVRRTRRALPAGNGTVARAKSLANV